MKLESAQLSWRDDVRWDGGENRSPVVPEAAGPAWAMLPRGGVRLWGHFTLPLRVPSKDEIDAVKSWWPVFSVTCAQNWVSGIMSK